MTRLAELHAIRADLSRRMAEIDAEIAAEMAGSPAPTRRRAKVTPRPRGPVSAEDRALADEALRQIGYRTGT
jgi:hypothetical protein